MVNNCVVKKIMTDEYGGKGDFLNVKRMNCSIPNVMTYSLIHCKKLILSIGEAFFTNCDS